VIVQIVMPYYGDIALMRAAVQSVLAQEDPRWRLTVVDDGQAEGVPEWFAGLGDERVRYLRNDNNLGVTGNFNRCLDLLDPAHELAVLTGCDDLLSPNYVATIIKAHQGNPAAGIIQPGVRVIDAAGRPTRTLVDTAKRIAYAPRFSGQVTLSGEELAVSLLRGDWLYFPSLAWRTEALAAVRFRADLRVIQDLALLLELVRRGESLLAVDTVCFSYRRHAASESATTAVDGSRFTEATDYFLGVATEMREHGWPRAAAVARRRLSSRVFALTMLPAALRSGGSAELLRHALGR
jgi:GT2 family glycosyltransferase